MSAEEYGLNFLGRMTALAAAHDAAFQADTGADLAALVARLLEPYAHPGEHSAITIKAGPPVSVPGRKVQALAFVLHELATNAVKHGALSAVDGGVQLGWRVDQGQGERHLHLDWRELGGPLVTPPSSHGFGMKLIRHASAGELDGSAELTFAPQGLVANITIRLS